MKKQLDKVLEFHKKFQRPFAEKPTVHLQYEKQLEFRHLLMKEEINEYLEGAKKGDIENVAKELADVLYTVYGTIIEHGLQEKMGDIFTEVHESNMSKQIQEDSQKLKKGENYKEANINQFFKK